MFDFIQSYITIELLAAAWLCARKLSVRERAGRLVPPLALALILLTSLRIGGRAVVELGYAGGLIFYLAVMLLVSGLVWLRYEATAFEALLYGVAAYAMQHCGHDVSMLALLALRLDVGAIIQTPLYACVRFGATALTYAALYRPFARGFAPDAGRVRSVWRWAALSGAILCLVTALYGVLQRSGISGFGDVVVHVYDCICTLFSLAILSYAARNDALAGELATLRQLWRLRRERYELSRESIEQINVKCHDIRRHINDLYARETGRDPGEGFAREVERSIRIYDQLYRTGNEYLDVILTEKGLICERNHIRLTCMADGARLGFLEAADLYCLFGNLLDNAIESVERIPDEAKRVVNLDVRERGGFLRIQEENYYAGPLEFRNGLPVTTKGDAREHGYGMKSIRLIVDKYGGELQITPTPAIFTLTALLPIPTAQRASGAQA